MLRFLAAAFIITYFMGLVDARAQNKVVFASADGDLRSGASTQINAVLYRGKGEGPRPGIVAIHGCNGFFDKSGALLEHYRSWAELLSGEGYTMMLTDGLGSRGHGDLCALRGERPVQANRELPRDAVGALAYLQGRPDVQADRIAMFGWSNGGQAALWTVAEQATVKPETGRPDFRAAVTFYPGCQNLISDKEPKWASRIPMLVLMGESDNFTPARFCKALFANAEGRGAPITFHLYPDTHHVFDAPNQPTRVVTEVKFPDGSSPTIGTNPEARADAIERVKRFLAAALVK